MTTPVARTCAAAIGLAAALLLVPAPQALADTATGRFPACGKRFWLEAMLEFRAQGADQRYERWINVGKCIELHKGLEVDVIDYYGDAEHKRVEFEINGYRFFTVREAIAKPL